jgi:pimeloyl-ACP methyl ester carboxylesterase
VLAPDGVPIHYEVHGRGAPAVVFVHGWSCDRSYWDAQVPFFSERHRMVTIDLAGHGESGIGRAAWSIEAFSQDVATVVTALGLEEVVLVGHSMGGAVVAEAARLLGDRVKVVVGVDTFHDLSERWTEEVMENWLSSFRPDFAARTRDFVRGMFVATSDSALVEHVATDMASAPPEVGIGSIAGYFDWWNDEADVTFGELRVPLRVINSNINPTNVDAGRTYVASFDAVLMSGVGHFVMMEDPDSFNRLLQEIIEEFT